MRGVVLKKAYRQAKALRGSSPERAEDDKNLKEAIRLLNNYLLLKLKDHEVQMHLGMLYAEIPDPAAAFITLEAVLRTDDGSLSQEDLRKARQKLIKMALRIGAGRTQKRTSQS